MRVDLWGLICLTVCALTVSVVMVWNIYFWYRKVSRSSLMRDLSKNPSMTGLRLLWVKTILDIHAILYMQMNFGSYNFSDAYVEFWWDFCDRARSYCSMRIMMIFERNFGKLFPWLLPHQRYLFNFGNKNTLRRRAAKYNNHIFCWSCRDFVGSDPAELRAGFVALAL